MVRLVCAAAVAAIVVSPSIAAAQPVPPVRLSVSTGGTEANGASTTMAVSRDGRHVLFSSTATNLVAGDTNGQVDFFVRDRDTDRDGVFDEPGAVATIRVTEGSLGEQTTDFHQSGQLSADGRFVLFITAAPLIAGDTNGVWRRLPARSGRRCRRHFRRGRRRHRGARQHGHGWNAGRCGRARRRT